MGNSIIDQQINDQDFKEIINPESPKRSVLAKLFAYGLLIVAGFKITRGSVVRLCDDLYSFAKIHNDLKNKHK